MLKVGVIGLGDIAQKAYLPIYGSMPEVEFQFYTRNQEKLKSLGGQYRFGHLHSNLNSLINSGISGALIHSATSSHKDLIQELLTNNIHVFVDKPITDNYTEAKELVDLANQKGLILMTGFNRRYAPSYVKLKEVEQPNMIIVQKNRNNHPGEIRNFIYDDFIHVIDTMRYLFPYPIEELVVSGKKIEGKLHHVVLQFHSKAATAIGIMNRDNGTTEEVAQVMGPFEKRTVYNVSKLVISKDMEEMEVRGSDWEPTLVKRGFVDMVQDFIHAIRIDSQPRITAVDALLTHEICEKVMKYFLENHENKQ